MSQLSTCGVVDVHTHAIPDRLPDLTRYDGEWPSIVHTAERTAQMLIGGSPYRVLDDRCWSADRRLADMDADGIDVQVLSPIPVTLSHDQPVAGAVVLAQAQNDFFAQLVACAPDRFRALGSVPLQDPSAAVDELVRCIDDLGLLGVEIGTRVGDLELSAPEFDDFFDAAADRGAFILIHPVDRALDPRHVELGMAFGMGMPAETATAGAVLITGPHRRGGAHICLAHGGGTLPAVLPRLDKGAELAGSQDPRPSDRARQLWCDSLTYDAASLELAMKRFGRNHVLLGTDYPFVARETPPGAVLDAFDVSVRDVVMRHNPAQFITGC
ncbi:amidohydrolase family protein [Rhodococcus oxybenzonivorans]|uniref:amidohydrolase family protein n=1 Tax=Rhodococcus oxybenzonivorans TaxID=1990687 RepID=UPI00295594CF|nr:amidohydrolase family protein [Rhodococcus oxybenzonivorans]MDV7353724.1 amidohydrolase family protein [Rhodococcus oxybenzonivorans]